MLINFTQYIPILVTTVVYGDAHKPQNLTQFNMQNMHHLKDSRKMPILKENQKKDLDTVNKKKLALLGLTALTAGAACLLPEIVHAASAPPPASMDEVYCDVRNLTSGNIGSIVGFGVAFLGFILLLMKGKNSGIVLIIIGISVTAFPGLINSFIEGMSTASSEAGNMTINDCASGKFSGINRAGTPTPTMDPRDALRIQTPQTDTYFNTDRCLKGGGC